ncbi:MAG: sel1 repeat family protein [Ignavibacteria bacterium]|nr:sel1 repeat family protein [Ignavibacteria bacterium]
MSGRTVTGTRREVFPAVALFLLAVCFPALPCAAQVRVESPVFRTYRPPRQQALPLNPDPEQQWRDLTLIREANAGDKFAQHELGLRFLFGDGFAADTAKAAYWIGRAAEQDLMQANYNYSLLMSSGWGVEWNPVRAALYLHRAADRGMPEAQHNYGLLFTDDLVFPRSWKEAKRWIALAADSGYAPAREALAEIARLGLSSEDDATETTPDAGGNDGAATRAPRAGRQGGWSPVFLDFRRDSSVAETADLPTLAREASASLSVSVFDSTAVGAGSAPASIASLQRMVRGELLREAAGACNPEAAVLYGRCLETGIIGTPDPIAGMEQYLRALYIDAARAFPFLNALARKPGVLADVQKRAQASDARAKLVLAELTLLGFDRRITDGQAVELLRDAGRRGSTQAAVQLGLLYQSGRSVERDARSAEQHWKRAAAEGDAEAAIRLAAAIAFADEDDERLDSAIVTLRRALQLGSVIAQVALASCAERGRGMMQDEGYAARAYRMAASRGSRLAFAALKRMVDRKR